MEILAIPFIQRALIGGVLVALLASWMGIFVVLRQSSFAGDAIAHSSLMGVALGLLIGVNPLLVAAIYAVFISLILPYIKKHTQLPIDSLLGFILPFSMGLGVIILSLLPGYQPELISFLFGSILAISWTDIAVISVLAIITLLIMIALRKKLVLTSFDGEYAKVIGQKVGRIDTVYQVLLAITIVVGIKLVGIILINALLVIPASTTRLFVKSLKEMFFTTPVLAIGIMLAGLFISIIVNIPTGPAIAAVSGIVFLMAILLKRLL